MHILYFVADFILFVNFVYHISNTPKRNLLASDPPAAQIASIYVFSQLSTTHETLIPIILIFFGYQIECGDNKVKVSSSFPCKGLFSAIVAYSLDLFPTLMAEHHIYG